MCLTPGFRPSPPKKEALNRASVSGNPSADSRRGHPVTPSVLALFWRLLFFFFTLNTPSFPLGKKKTQQNSSFSLAGLKEEKKKSADEAFVL